MLEIGIHFGAITEEGACILFQTAYGMQKAEYRAVYRDVTVSSRNQAVFALELAKGIKQSRITPKKAIELYCSAYGMGKADSGFAHLAIHIAIGDLNEFGWDYAP
ncbi:hypothetical protein [Thalassobacillus pellis]|uniref:hypothetical protein n=1 Tax=Thalassobacillus pellis TaxID=748008 RepID=UPI001960F375|nr:hypothetical protein [Thalassobacillus pellis]MBM7554532.1 hypothetical protein [Thalassobacillus pellis]